MPKTLTSWQRYLLEHSEILKDFNPQRRGGFYRDVRRKANQELEDLIFLAQYLPEKQQAKVFNVETLRPLVEAFLKPKEQDKTGLVSNKRVFLLAERFMYLGMSKGNDLINSPWGATLLVTPSHARQANAISFIAEILRHQKKP